MVRNRTYWSASLRGVVASLLALAMVLGTWTTALAAEGEPQQQSAAAGPTRAEIKEAIGALQASQAKTEPVSEWVAFALARGGKPIQDRYLAQVNKSVTPDAFRLVTDYARVALAINANGWDVRKAGPSQIDLLAKIANFDKMTSQGPNAPAFALMALDAGGYEAPGAKDRWTRDSLIKWLVENRNADGGWSLAGKSEPDVTGIVLTALANYKDREDVKPVVEQGLAWLSAAQLPSGGFGGPESSESAVQAVIALTALDIDPSSDSRFVKSGKSVLARLLEFRLADGSFAHVPGGKSDGLSSLYALLGLTAFDRWQDGLPGLYSGVRTQKPISVKVYGPQGKVAEGTGNGRTALESLVQVLQRNNVSYEVQRHPQFGPYLTAIGKDMSGQFGGYDGWQYAVKKDGKWARDLTGMAAYDPAGSQELIVYYGGESALIHSVKWEPQSPREYQPITVTVEQETYDWTAGKTVVGPAEAANVTIGGVSAVTGKDGKATLQGVKAGAWTLRVDGYKTGASPAFVTSERPITVQSYVKNVTVRIEGDQGLVAEGQARGGTALEAVESLLKQRNIPYEVKELSFGKYISAIGGIQAGKYGGYDGWMFALENGSSWTYPSEGIGTYLLEENSKIVVYYGDSTKLAEAAVVTPGLAKPGQPIAVSVSYRDMDWETGKPGPAQPLAGAKVSAAGISAVTDASGQAKLAVMPEGVHELLVTGYAADKAPSVVRSASRIFVAGDYADQSAIASWAADGVRTARAAKVLLGPGDSAVSFDPKAAVTRAEFVSALVRATGLAPEEGSSFTDVRADAWYAKEIEAAFKAGLIAGVAPGKFAPDAKLTREQAAQLLVRALKLQTAGSVAFADAAQVTVRALPAVQSVIEQGWMTVQENGKFQPKQTMTREQAALIAVRVLMRPGVGRLGD